MSNELIGFTLIAIVVIVLIVGLIFIDTGPRDY